MNIILHDYNNHLTFAPLTLTRPVGNLRAGMWTNDERWQFYRPNASVSFQTESYLSKRFATNQIEDNFWVNAAVIPNEFILNEIEKLNQDESLFVNDIFVAHRGKEFNINRTNAIQSDKIVILENRWDLFQKNDQILKADFAAYTKNKTSKKLSSTNTLLGDENQLFIEEGAVVECAVLNVKEGPIYIGKDAEIMEGSVVRGGLAMAERSVLKLSTKVYGATSLGPHCKVGGEVNNVIFQAYSNKGHDGFIGNSLIGEWCNLGADTNCSNLKNNYGNVKTYNYHTKKVEQTNVQFMGVVMGDFSKTSINTMLNTATVIGISANIFCSEFPPKYVSNFSWGGLYKSPIYDLDRVLESIYKMMERRGKSLTLAEKEIIVHLFKEV
ncbi:MAG: putative sugar nucleotidyl transferase [Brumimicrobium sp.]